MGKIKELVQNIENNMVDLLTEVENWAKGNITISRTMNNFTYKVLIDGIVVGEISWESEDKLVFKSNEVLSQRGN